MKRSRGIGAVVAGLVAGLLGCVLVAAPAQAKAQLTPDQQQAQEVARYWLDHGRRNMKLATPVVQQVQLSRAAAAETAGLSQLLGGNKNAFKPPKLPSSVGRVFFVDQDGKPRWCSGVALTSKYRNIVATAGQCTDQQLDRWVFVPGYSHGKAPHGVFVAKQAFVHYDWEVYGDADRNYAFVVVHNGVTLKGKKLQDVGRLGDAVGGQGFAWNQPTGQRVVLGYSAGWPVGFWVRELLDDASVDETFPVVVPSIKGEELLGIRPSSPFTNSLGSAWLHQYSATKQLGYLNGITIATSSGLLDGAVSLSAPFDGETYQLYTQAGNVWTGSIS